MAITTNAQAIQEINAALLVDGQNIKQLLLDLAAWIGAGGGITPQAGPTELTDNTAGTPSTSSLASIPAAVASTGADTTAATAVSVNASLAAVRNDLSSLNTLTNALLAKLVTAGVLTSV